MECRFNKETKKWEITAKDFDNFCASLSNTENKEMQIQAAKRRLSNLNSALYYVRGIRGDMIPTESVYAAFIKPLKEFTENFPDREYINTSLVGAQIDGYKNMPLEDALADSEKIENRELVSDYQYDIIRIKENVQLALADLKTCIPKLEEGKRLVKTLRNDLKRYRTANREVLQGLKKLSLNYADMSTVFAKKNLLFDFITTAERIDLDYEMKMTKEFTLETILNLTEKINTYYDNAEKRINYITKLLQKSCEALS